MEILVYQAFYAADPARFPMTLEAMSAYIWLQQAFLSFFGAWMLETELFEDIVSGNIAYQLCRPVGIYEMWFSRSAANRVSRAVLRCFPILIVAVFLPAPYGLTTPASMPHFLLFLFTLLTGLLVMVAFGMLVCVLAFYTISPDGLRILFVSSVELLAGAVIPLPFFPERLQLILEVLPFASMQNVPLRIYSGSMSGGEMVRAVCLQVFWLVVIVAVGKLLCTRAERRLTVQGG